MKLDAGRAKPETAVEEERKTAFRASIKASADEQEDFFLLSIRE
jgi:hypothetical protein